MRRSLLALPLLVACSGAADKDTGGTDIDGDAAAGADVYASNCAGCHGANGEGGSGPALADEVPEKSDADLEGIITNGTGSMPGFELEDQEMADLIAYLRENYG